MTPDNQEPLATARAVVDALGGGKTVADMCRISMQAVSNWCAEGEIPPAWFDALSSRLRARGYSVDPRVFGQRRIEVQPTEIPAPANG